MRLIRRTKHSIPDLRNGCVATIGAFDGLHIGHRKILDRVRLVAAEQQLPSLVFSFEPLPKEYFSQGVPPARLMKFREKFQALDRLGFDWFFCPRFELALANLEPDTFIDELLVDLDVVGLGVVGLGVVTLSLTLRAQESHQPFAVLYASVNPFKENVDLAILEDFNHKSTA